MKEETKRLDVAELQDLEKRIDVLEGQPETPLVCPIFKSDLDDMNDRITVLEGGTAPGPQNPMRLSELSSFEGRVEELEDKPQKPLMVFDDAFKTKFASYYDEVKDEGSDKYFRWFDVATNTGCPAIFVVGPDTTVTISNNKPVVSGDNQISVGFLGETAYLIEDWDGTKLPDATLYHELCTLSSVISPTFENILSATWTASQAFKLDTDITLTDLFNPAKLIVIWEDCDALSTFEIDFDDEDADIFPIKEQTE